MRSAFSVLVAAFLCLFGLVFLFALPAATLLEPPPFGLNDDVVPHYYSIDLAVDPNRDRYHGAERIRVELYKPVQILWLNATNLDISEASVDDGKRKLPARITPVGSDFVALELSSRITTRTALLSLEYDAPLADHAVVGPYRLKYNDDWYVFTTFTPNGARSAFPCFDQLRFKTPWELSIRVRRDLSAFANAKIASETDEPGGMKTVQFAATVPLPSEVVAFAVGPFDTLTAPSADHGDVPVRIVTPRGRAADGHDAALSSEVVMTRLEAYTGIHYPFDKLDHVALPEAPFGAIENPGLITYRMRSLLLTPGDATPARQRSVRAIESHEMAHQWFGDLVTQASWEDVWLSEGFATWLSAKMMDEDQPQVRRHLAAAIARERIMAADSGPSARPVRSAIHNRDDFKTVYNQFVYQKGAAILGMLENWIGPRAFQLGLQRYLRNHRFANATTGELAADLRVATGVDPAEVMRDFLDQIGVPQVRAEIHCEPGTEPRIVFEQTNAAAQWNVPVCWRTESEGSCVVVDTRRQVDLAEGASCPTWVYPNAGGVGYYRTSLDARQIAAMTTAAPWYRFTAAERLTLVHDLAPLRPSGRPEVISALRKLAGDPEPEIAAAAAAAIDPDAARQSKEGQ